MVVFEASQLVHVFHDLGECDLVFVVQFDPHFGFVLPVFGNLISLFDGS